MTTTLRGSIAKPSFSLHGEKYRIGFYVKSVELLHGYLEPNSNSMQKPIGGLSSLDVTNYLNRCYRLLRAKQNNPNHFTFSRRSVLSSRSIVTPSSPEATVNHKGVNPIIMILT